jgi:hypothetical protein
MALSEGRRQGLFVRVLTAISALAMIPEAPWLIIINVLGVIG